MLLKHSVLGLLRVLSADRPPPQLSVPLALPHSAVYTEDDVALTSATSDVRTGVSGARENLPGHRLQWLQAHNKSKLPV